ncbi:hypothetical protein K9L05_02495 [Candidatus Babeliales bacterium]|nr:hypothetical protein [Candidatus Babeliales bacterium]MCF7899495.1 hypothetical protein [Candidatus Babeliales bacterium]
MKQSFKTGLGFGITSGVITTLGLIVGLYSGTESALAVLGGILTIAVADGLSDSLGVHVSKEFEGKYSEKELWESTLITFASKFIIALSFTIPVLLFSIKTAIILCIIWGLFLLASFSFFMAKIKKVKWWHVVIEHLLIGILVILATNYLGEFIKSFIK